ncbi:AAA family ATPase [uncultured Chryseobacterium sp.]|jgi:ABC-type antimicrobial peptide transport system, ATPase component|uniref:ATP-dependent nuclease n=1 Tax=uncultured Chryseobacterium sp. TaxID=259322 RepID=UPI002622E4A5|nr:AAA family ATPase [uncultured Chryseobacterium sp.]
MATSQQVLKIIRIKKLKGLKEVDLSLNDKPLTAIMGPNGSGKSTILHALACINSPENGNVDYKFSYFFIPTTHSMWEGSNFSIVQDYRIDQTFFPDVLTEFRKDIDRWAPRYATRIHRYVSFIGIRTSVPAIEREGQKTIIQFNSIPLDDSISSRVLHLARFVMNRNYTAYNNHVTPRSKAYIGVTCDSINYSSLSMGAGEQRIFYILSEVLRAPRYGLILIDEIDLLLHEGALRRLLAVLNVEAEKRHLQIIFTSHSHAITEMDFISVKHLFQTPKKTLCFSRTTPDALFRLTGIQQRPLHLFVEDKLAYALVNKVAAEEGMARQISISTFGTADNCFTGAAGAVLTNLSHLGNMLFILDGDVYASEEEKTEQIRKFISGDDIENIEKRQQALSMITQLTLPKGQSPEPYYHQLICRLDDALLTEEQQEIKQIAISIVAVGNSHDYLNNIIDQMSVGTEVALSKLADIISLAPEWGTIKANVRDWLMRKKALTQEKTLNVLIG